MSIIENQRRGIYLLMIEEKAEANYLKLNEYVGDDDIAGKMAGSYHLDGLFDDGELGLGDDDIYSHIGLERRGGIHFDEACDLINAMTRDKSYRRMFDLVLTRTSFDETKQRSKKEQIEVRMNRVQMIERLEWISSMDFGDDVDAWEEWREVRTLEGFFTRG